MMLPVILVPIKRRLDVSNHFSAAVCTDKYRYRAKFNFLFVPERFEILNCPKFEHTFSPPVMLARIMHGGWRA
jgi:hypothetical protein